MLPLLAVLLAVQTGPAKGAGVDVLVLDVEGVQIPAAELRAVGLAVAQRLDARDDLRAASTEDVRQLLAAEGLRQVTECGEDVSCLADIGNALGARYLVAGRVTRTGDELLWQATLLDAVEVRALERTSRSAADVKGLVNIADDVADALLPPPASPLSLGLLAGGGVVAGLGAAAATVFGVWTYSIDRTLAEPPSPEAQQQAFKDAAWVPWAFVGGAAAVVVGGAVAVTGALVE